HFLDVFEGNYLNERFAGSAEPNESYQIAPALFVEPDETNRVPNGVLGRFRRKPQAGEQSDDACCSIAIGSAEARARTKDGSHSECDGLAVRPVRERSLGLKGVPEGVAEV